MCGIVGAIGNIDVVAEKAVQQMLIFDTVRGEHSTGLLGVKKHSEDEYILAKQVGNPHELFDTARYKEIMSGSSRVLIGHNRYATQGKVNKTNAHPFDFDTLVGVHNGSLTNKYQLHEGAKWDVDSQALYAHIEARGVEDALRIANGAFALVWWDKETNHVNFIRNDERPLYYALTDEKGKNPIMFFASESWMIEVATMRTGIKIHNTELFEKGLLHSIPVEKGGVLGKPVIRPVEFAPPTTTTYYNGYTRQVGSTQSKENSSGSNVVGIREGNVQGSSTTTTSTAASTGAEQVVSKRSVMDARFVSAKEVLLEAVCVQTDKFGADYVVGFAPEHPYLECRLYRHSAGDRIFNAIGCEFTGDISSFVMVEANRGYYKISPHSVRIVSMPTTGNAEDDVGDTLYPNHKGEDIDMASWQKKYGTCVFCSSNVLPTDLEEGARFTREGEILCKDCVQDTELARYVDLV